MNYLKQYVKLMRKGQTRDWTKRSAPVYVEKHHIFPESIFGKNKFVVYLTAREHYIAHALLYKALIKRFGPDDARSIKMVHAFLNMHVKSPDHLERYFNSKLYEKLKIIFSESRRGEKHPLFGKSPSEAVRQKIREGISGKNHPMFGKTGKDHQRYGKPLSEEAKLKIGNANRGRKHTLKAKEKMSKSRIGNKLTEEHKRKLSKPGKLNSFYGKFHTPEVCQKLRELNSGENNPGYGKTWFTNGINNMRAFECPTGYYKGMTTSRRKPDSMVK
jgi:hypothetical protein